MDDGRANGTKEGCLLLFLAGHSQEMAFFFFPCECMHDQGCCFPLAVYACKYDYIVVLYTGLSMKYGYMSGSQKKKKKKKKKLVYERRSALRPMFMFDSSIFREKLCEQSAKLS